MPVTTPPPFWIIVSDEGHAAIPARHATEADATKEAYRLTALKPEVNFTVYKSVFGLKTPKVAPEKTTYDSGQVHWNYPFSYQYVNSYLDRNKAGY